MCTLIPDTFPQDKPAHSTLEEQESSQRLVGWGPLRLSQARKRILLFRTASCGCAHFRKSLEKALRHFTERVHHPYSRIPIHLRRIAWRVKVRTSYRFSFASTLILAHGWTSPWTPIAHSSSFGFLHEIFLALLFVYAWIARGLIHSIVAPDGWWSSGGERRDPRERRLAPNSTG